jgi:regulator of protease activity HflC (stomatin/prohibitin superfamily)
MPIPTSVIFVLTVIVLALIFAFLGLKKVNEGTVLIIERLGKYNRTLKSGMNFIIPGLDTVKKDMMLYTYIEDGSKRIDLVTSKGEISLAEQTIDPPAFSTIASDNAIVLPDLICNFMIVEPQKAVYNISNLGETLLSLLETTLRQQIGKLNSDQVITSRDIIGSNCKEQLEKASEAWGTKITRVEIQAINFDEQVQKKLTDAREQELVRRAEVIAAKEERDKKILKAEGAKQAQILGAEGEKQSQLLKAEAEKQSQVLEAEGKFESDKLKAEGQYLLASKEMEGKAKGEAAMAEALAINPQGLLALKTLEAQAKIAESFGKSSNAVIIPAETAGIFGALGSLNHVLKSFNLEGKNQNDVNKEIG